MEASSFSAYHLVPTEDLRLVDARSYGQDQTSRTIHAALAAIGPAHLLLALLPLSPLETPRVRSARWTLDEAVTIPAHVPLLIAPEVMVDGAGFLLIAGDLITWRRDWYQGTCAWRCDGEWLCL
jgi:hypothetical protein